MRVFLDATCWVAAAGSSTGGSAAILELGKAEYLQIVATPRVLREAERNIKNRMGDAALLRYYRLLASIEIETVSTPTETEADAWKELTAEKDCHVLAGALNARADVLVTLDRKHLLPEAVKSRFPIPTQTPGEFLTALREE
jgi:predicted nucleic acid-binding protein